MISGSLILNLNVNWFLYQSLLDLLLPMDMSDMTGMGSMLPELAAVFKASKLVSVNKIARVRATFIWPCNENGGTKQKQQTNGNRAIWLVYPTDTNTHGFWLVKQTLGWKKIMQENFLETNWYFALTSHCNTIGQSNITVSTLGFSLAGKRWRVSVLIFSFIGWYNKKPNAYFKVIRISLYLIANTN